MALEAKLCDVGREIVLTVRLAVDSRASVGVLTPRGMGCLWTWLSRSKGRVRAGKSGVEEGGLIQDGFDRRTRNGPGAGPGV